MKIKNTIGKYNALDVAKYIINYSNSKEYQGIAISNLRLQKLLYFVQSIFLVNKKISCFKENMRAWELGPVVPEVYYKYRENGIMSLRKEEDFNEDIISEDDRKLISAIVDHFKNHNVFDLVDLTHDQTPWKDAYNEGKGRNSIIKKESIFEYFSKKVK